MYRSGPLPTTRSDFTTYLLPGALLSEAFTAVWAPNTFLPYVWDLRYDTVMFNESYFRMFGIYSLGIDTLSRRFSPTARDNHNYSAFASGIAPGTPSQLVTIDTTFDNRNGSLQFGLVDGITGFTPRFQPGYISIGSVGTSGEPSPPSDFELGQNFPNPFNPSTEIEFTLSIAGRARLEIYDMLGREVRRLLDGPIDPGRYAITWDGKNDIGQDVPSGTYFYRLTSANLSETKKMTLLK